MSVAETFWNSKVGQRFYGLKTIDVSSLSWRELRAKAKELGIENYTRMKRPELEKVVKNELK